MTSARLQAEGGAPVDAAARGEPRPGLRPRRIVGRPETSRDEQEPAGPGLGLGADGDVHGRPLQLRDALFGVVAPPEEAVLDRQPEAEPGRLPPDRGLDPTLSGPRGKLQLGEGPDPCGPRGGRHGRAARLVALRLRRRRRDGGAPIRRAAGGGAAGGPLGWSRCGSDGGGATVGSRGSGRGAMRVKSVTAPGRPLPASFCVSTSCRAYWIIAARRASTARTATTSASMPGWFRWADWLTGVSRPRA